MGHGSTLLLFNWVSAHAAAGTGPAFELCCVWPFTDTLNADQGSTPTRPPRALSRPPRYHDDNPMNPVRLRSGKPQGEERDESAADNRSCMPKPSEAPSFA